MSSPDRDLLILVPAFNEEASIAHTLNSIRDAQPGVPILVVDDGSADATRIIAEQCGAWVVTLPCHLGLGGCVQTGYKVAHELGFQYVIRMDADGQHPPEALPTILDALRRTHHQVVIGSRYVGRYWAAGEGVRAWGIRFFRFLLRPILGRWVFDPTSGFIGVKRQALGVFARSFPLEYPEIEMLVVLQRKTFTFLEVPCVMRPRFAGQSTLTMRRSIYFMVHVLLGVAMNVLRFPGFGAWRKGDRK
jgi:glycosyltransferase involved in cell wall biosynthesis